MKNSSKPSLSIISIFCLTLIVLALIFESPRAILRGMHEIIIAPDILLTDYIEVGGIGAAFFNAGLMGLINIWLLSRHGLKVSGLSIAALFTVIGFSFIGKNIFNFWPIYIGGSLYSKIQKIEFKSILLILMFSTTLSPVVSEIAFGTHLPAYLGIPFGILIGILVGFLVTPLSKQMAKFHDGYNLYNIGFTGGILGTLITSLLRSFGLTIETQSVLSNNYSLLLCLFFSMIFLIYIMVGYYLNGKNFRNYKRIFKYTGRVPTDFKELLGDGITLINMGLMGLICIGFVIVCNGIFNGPVIAGILTVVGFSAYGKHPKNSIPILLGIILASAIKIWDTSSTVVIIAGLFGTTLAPIAGQFGWIAGIIAGCLHLSISMNVGIIHGGINLYNNGFAGGMVAGIIVPILKAFKENKLADC